MRASPRANVSPGDLSQRTMTASAIESESLGIVSSRATWTSVLELASGQSGRERRGEPALPHPLQLVAQLLLELVETTRLDPLGFELRAEEHDRVARLPVVELSLGPVGAGIAARVADEAIRERLDEGRAVAVPRARDRSLGSVTDDPYTHAVDRLGGDLPPPPPPPNPPPPPGAQSSPAVTDRNGVYSP